MTENEKVVRNSAPIGRPALTIRNGYVVSVKSLDFEGDRGRRVVYDEAMVVIGESIYRVRCAPGVLSPGITIEEADVTGKSGFLVLTLVTGGPNYSGGDK